MSEATIDAPALAIAYRKLVLWFGAQLALGLLGPVVHVGLSNSRLGAIFGPLHSLCVVVIAIALIIYAYRTAGSLGSTVPAVWAIAMCVPVVNIITLLLLSSKATRACREAGIAVGFLGPKIGAVPPGENVA